MMSMNSHFINGVWRSGEGEALTSIDPATGQPCWQGTAATASEARDAVAAARSNVARWAQTPIADRITVAERFAKLVDANRDDLAATISAETGKPRWEAAGEVDAMMKKVPVTLEVMRHRRPMEGPFQIASSGEATRYKPIGALIVLGPFNLPGHLPNGHIVPALIAGNTVVFKPSDRTPWTGVRMAALWEAAGLPAGVLNVVQGAGEVGAALVNDINHDGVLFTGGLKAGLALRRALVDQPQRILALEMGGNNPLVVRDVSDGTAAAVQTVRSAFITAGQRCTCARRLIVPEGDDGDRFLETLLGVIDGIRVDRSDGEPAPFMGPLIDGAAADAIVQASRELQKRGGRALRDVTRPGPSDAFVTPGVIDVTDVEDRADEELFGPLLQVIRAADFDAAIREANDTAFGLVAGLLSDRRDLYQHFHQHVRAGLINWNKPTTGASSQLPFGGVGKSGNFRPSGAHAIDYCTYPVASLESEALSGPESLPHGLTRPGETSQGQA